MFEIQFYCRPSESGTVRVRYDPSVDFASRLSDADKRAVESNWARLIKADASLWGPAELGTLVDASDGNLRYGRASYDIWRAAHDMRGQNNLSQRIFDELKISSVGVAVATSDGKVLVHEKPAGAPAGGRLDSSANGFCELKDGQLDFDISAREKLQRELGIESSDLTRLELRGVHSASDYYSGMLAYSAETSLTFNEVNERLNTRYVHKLHGIDKEKLPGYTAEKYTSGELIGDGAATLMAALDHDEFIKTIQRIRGFGGKIRLGKLDNGEFIESIDDALG